MTFDIQAIKYVLALQAILTLFLVALLRVLASRLQAGPFFAWWAWAWLAFGIAGLAGWSALGFRDFSGRLVLVFLWTVGGFLQACLMLFGAQELQGHLTRRRRWLWLALSASAGALVFVLSQAGPAPFNTYATRAAARQGFLGIAFAVCAWRILRHWNQERLDGFWLTSLACWMAGLFNLLVALVLTPVPTWLGWDLAGIPFSAVEAIAECGIIIGAVIALLDAHGRSQQALQASERRYRELVEHTHLLICTHNLAGDLLSVSASAARQYGASPASLVGRNLREFIPERYHQDYAAYLERIRSTGQDSGLVRMQAADGRSVLLVYRNVVYGEQGNETIVLGAGVDITAEHRAKAALKAAEARYQHILDSATEGIAVIDAAGAVSYLNDSLARLTGVERQELIGRPVAVLVGEDLADRAALLWQELRRGQPVQHALDIHRHGAPARLHLSLTPLFERGTFSGALACVTDITARYHAECQLARSEARYRDLVENASDLIFVLDAEGRFTDWNRAAETTTGYCREEARGLRLADLLLPGPEAGDGLLRSGSRAQGELRLRTRQGGHVILEVTARPLFHSGQDAGETQVMARDVTERRSLEEHLRQTQRMEAAGQLAAGVAHDFNNLLVTILGYSDLLQERIPRHDPNRRMVDDILRAAESASGLTRQLLAFSRPREGGRPRVINLNELISSMEGLLRGALGDHIPLEIVRDPHLKLVAVDPAEMEQALLNLLLNARDAVGAGGRVRLETANLEIAAASWRRGAAPAPGGYVTVAVRDDGDGMDAETRSRCFEPFYTTKPAGRGSGLGLASVYGIVQRAGGYITVESEPGEGAAFQIYLPVAVDAPSTLAPPPLSPRDVRGAETVLLVEDENAVRDLVCEYLESRGYQVLPATSGAEALSLAEHYHGPIHLLLTDVIMPGMSGRDVAERFLKSRPRSRLLYMSGYTDGLLSGQGIEERGPNFLQKPFKLEALGRKIREVLDT
jgi:PAS domain S-box-containing protein